MKKLLALTLGVALAVMAFAGCAPAQQAAQPETAESAQASAEVSVDAQAEKTQEQSAAAEQILDMAGNPVEPVEVTDRIVSITPAGTEIVCAMGLGDKVIGVDAFSNYPAEEIQGAEIVGDFNGPDVEKIVALEPDIVLCGIGLQVDAMEQLKKLGIPVACVEATTFEEIPTAISLVGKLMGTELEADMLNKMIEEAATKAKEQAKDMQENPVSVYFAMSYGDMGNWTSGPGSFINSMVELSGGEAVTADAPDTWIEYSVENLATSNPDLILLASDGGTVEGLKAAAGYQDLDAVKAGNVHLVDADVISRPGPRIVEAIETISSLIAEQYKKQ